MTSRNDAACLCEESQHALLGANSLSAELGAFSLLSSESFAPFKARRLSHASLIYKNAAEMASDERIVDSFGFAVPSELDEGGYEGETKTFHADRYGGLGVSRHGGSGRCGAAGRWQVKGIGQTPLLDRHPTGSFFWHSHGGVALSDGLQEVIWSNIFQSALPYGAAKSPALISTNTKTWFEHEIGQKGHAPRVLILRDQALRPAHFERSAHFSMNPVGRVNDDVDRVRAAIYRLPALLPQSRQRAEIRKFDAYEALQSGLEEMLRRFAAQIAASQSKRLVHGALGSANFCLDGRYIDFGTACQFPHYLDSRSYKLPPNLATFWGQRNQPAEIVNSLCFYINKYFPFAEGHGKLNSKEFIDGYFGFYSYALIRSLLSLCGFPEHLIGRFSSKSELRLLAGLLFSNARKRWGVVLPAQSDLRTLGANGLEHPLRMFMNVNVLGDDASVPGSFDAGSQDRMFVEVYRQAARVVVGEAQREGVHPQALRKMMTIHMAKQLVFLPELSRDGMRANNIELMNKFEVGLRDKDDIQNYVDDLSSRGAVLFTSIRDYRTLLWRDGGRDLLFDAKKDCWMVQDQQSRSATRYALDDPNVPYLSESSQLLGVPLRELVFQNPSD